MPIETDASPKSPDLLCFSHLRWHFVTQRPQHLLGRAARDRRVFFWEEPVWHEQGELARQADGGRELYMEILQEGPSLWVVRPHLTWGIDFEAGQRQLLDELLTKFGIGRYITWYYTPMAWGFSDHLSPEATVYDCMDELSNFAGAPQQLREREMQLLEASDVVFTGGISLYESKRRRHSNVHAFPSSIDAGHFAKAKEPATIAQVPAEYESIPHPRAGFYGVLDERFDQALLAGVVRARADVHFVLLGPVVKIDAATLPQAANIHYLGSKAYEELPFHLAAWDAALLPFAMNEATLFISPTKTPEYLAAGKPVVSTPIRDVVREYGAAGLVEIAATAEEFAAALDRALLPPTAEWQQAVARKLAPLSWDNTWDKMELEIERCLRGRKIAAAKEAPVDLPAVRSASLRAAVPVSPRRLPSPRHGVRNGRSPQHMEHFDYVVVGAGFAGSVLAERLACEMQQRVLVTDKREHIAGNAYDYRDAAGILVHKYGPHIFHTSSEKVFTYLSRFTAWRPYEHRVLTCVDGQLLPMPINLDTINRLYGLSLDADGMRRFLEERAEKISFVRTSEDIVLSRVGRELYEKFFRNYTRKQWGLDPAELDASVAGRIPVRFNHDDRYFSDTYQAMPRDGYTCMFERMLDHPNITIRTGVDYAELASVCRDAKIIYTGPIDEYYNYRFGPLPYRSLEFKHETHSCEVYQPAPVVNYPNEGEHTRITEFKYLTGQKHAKTSIVYEYPRSEGEPYYPIPRAENAARYAKYRSLADRDANVIFCGRLANYRYFNMDQVVAQALTTFEGIAKEHRVRFTPLHLETGAGDTRSVEIA